MVWLVEWTLHMYPLANFKPLYAHNVQNILYFKQSSQPEAHPKNGAEPGNPAIFSLNSMFGILMFITLSQLIASC